MRQWQGAMDRKVGACVRAANGLWRDVDDLGIVVCRHRALSFCVAHSVRCVFIYLFFFGKKGNREWEKVGKCRQLRQDFL